MGREAQKKREEEAARAPEESIPGNGPEPEVAPEEIPDREQQPQGQQIQIDQAMLGMLANPQMTAMEDRRFLVQTIAVSKKDDNGLREITFPVNATQTITLVLAEELQQHILKQLTGDLQIADLGDLEAVRKAAEEAEKG